MNLLGLPVIWRTAYDWRHGGYYPPRRCGDALVHCAGKMVVGLDPSDGRVRWRAELVMRGAETYFNAVIGQTFVTRRSQPPENIEHLVGFAPDGTIRWDLPIEGKVSVAATHAIDHDRLIFPIAGGEEPGLCALDERGALTRFAFTASHVVVDAGGMIVARSMPAAGSAALERRTMAGVATVSATDVRGGVWTLLDVGTSIVTVEGGVNAVDPVTKQVTQAGSYRLTSRVRDTLALRWELDCGHISVAVGEGRVGFVASDGEMRVPVLADVDSGEVLWRGAPLAKRIDHVVAVGPRVVFTGFGFGNAFTWSGDEIAFPEASISHRVEMDATARRMYVGLKDGAACLALPGAT